MLHAQQPDRGEYQRHRRGLAEYRGGEIALGDIDQYALAKLDRFEIGAVGAQRVLGIGTAVGVIEKRFRHAALVQLAQILDAGDMFHRRFRPFLYLSLESSSS